MNAGKKYRSMPIYKEENTLVLLPIFDKKKNSNNTRTKHNAMNDSGKSNYKSHFPI